MAAEGTGAEEDMEAAAEVDMVEAAETVIRV